MDFPIAIPVLRRTLSTHHIILAADMLRESNDLEIQAGWHNDGTEWLVVRESVNDMNVYEFRVITRVRGDVVDDQTVSSYTGLYPQPERQ